VKKAVKKQGGSEKDGRWGLAPGLVQEKQRFDRSSNVRSGVDGTAVASDEYLDVYGRCSVSAVAVATEAAMTAS